MGDPLASERARLTALYGVCPLCRATRYSENRDGVHTLVCLNGHTDDDIPLSSEYPACEYGDCDHGVVERGWEHEGMALPVRFPEDRPLDGCEW